MDKPMRRVAMMVDRSDVDWLFDDLVKGNLKDRDTVSPSESQSAWIPGNRGASASFTRLRRGDALSR